MTEYYVRIDSDPSESFELKEVHHSQNLCPGKHTGQFEIYIKFKIK